MKIFVSRIALTCILVATVFTVKSNDSLRIHITNKHYLNADGQSSGYRIIRQQFLTADSIFFREINFDEATGKIRNYVFLFYRDNRLFTEECYNPDDTLMYIIKHEYDSRGNEKQTQKLVLDDGVLKVLEKTLRKFNQLNQPAQIKKYYGKKVGTIVNYTYDDAGLMVNETTTHKPAAKVAFKEETKIYSHSDDKKIKQIQITGIENNGASYSYSEEYFYDTNGQLSAIKKRNPEGDVITEKVFKYLKSGNPYSYEELNDEGKTTLKLHYEYRKHFMNKGNQVSYYENL